MLDDTLYYGFHIGDNTAHAPHNDLLHCVVVGLLMFAASAGAVLGFLSEFELSANYPLILISILVASMFLSLIHMTKALYNFGYIIFFVIFIFALTNMTAEANSGFQAILNVVNEAYAEHYGLSVMRQYTELITDRYTTITTVCIFLGIFLILPLNVDVFNNMMFFAVFFVTFWPLQIGTFIGKYPSYISLVLIFFSYFGVFLLRSSGHYRFVAPAKANKKREYALDYDDKKGRHVIFHKSNALSMLALTSVALVTAIVLSVFSASSIMISEREAVTNKSTPKETLDEYVKILTQTGILGLFNRYEAKGGINGGKLGGIRSVSPDYETDLEVTFVPYSFETIYLKGYTSQFYTQHSWDAPAYSTHYESYQPPLEAGYMPTEVSKLRALHEANTLGKLMDSGVTDRHEARMTVKNVDASSEYVYVPYFTSSLPNKALLDGFAIIRGASPRDQEATYEYMPYTSSMMPMLYDNADNLDWVKTTQDLDIMDTYEQEVYANYLQIPAEIEDVLTSYHRVIGESDNPYKQIELIYQYFLDNYTYDMAPGATPEDEDFVTYFLNEQKRGYCAHFASAGALLLRSYGIPARYCEGYVITTSGISTNAVTNDTIDSSYYYTGENPLGRSTVVTTEVTDADAHAWVEVYIHDFGWFPVEFTVPDYGGEDNSYSDFMNSLTRLFRPMDIGESDAGTDSGLNAPSFNPKSFLNLKNTPAFTVFVWILIVLLLIPIVKRSVKLYSESRARARARARGDHLPTLIYAYRKASDRLRKMYHVHEPDRIERTYELMQNVLIGHYPVMPTNMTPVSVIRRSIVRFRVRRMDKRMSSYLNKKNIALNELKCLTQLYIYSTQKPSKKEADALIRFYRSICSHVIS